MKNVLAIELGTYETTFFLKGSGFVLREASIVAISDDEVVAVGNEAKKMIGKSSRNIEFVHPVVEGVIVNELACSIMLKHFLSKVIATGLFARSVKAVFCVPCGTKAEEKKQIEKVAYKSGISEVAFIPSVVAAKVGMGRDLSINEAVLVCDIGAGKTDIAIVSRHNLLSGITMGVGGNDMDIALNSFIEKTYGMKISMQLTEKIKSTIGSLYANDIGNFEALGIDKETKSPRSEIIGATDVRAAVLDFYKDIADKIEIVISSANEDIMADIAKNGVIMVGGASRILGLNTYLKQRLGLNIDIADNPENNIILGAGQLLGDEKTLSAVIASN